MVKHENVRFFRQLYKHLKIFRSGLIVLSFFCMFYEKPRWCEVREDVSVEIVHSSTTVIWTLKEENTT